MTNEDGLNLAGVETVLEMEVRVEAMKAELEAMRQRTRGLETQLNEEAERVHEHRDPDPLSGAPSSGAVPFGSDKARVVWTDYAGSPFYGAKTDLSVPDLDFLTFHH